jgi:hypothetical protein
MDFKDPKLEFLSDMSNVKFTDELSKSLGIKTEYLTRAVVWLVSQYTGIQLPCIWLWQSKMNGRFYNLDDGTLQYDTESILQYSLYVSQSSYDIH